MNLIAAPLAAAPLAAAPLVNAPLVLDEAPLRIGICSTYAPRACGLATFAGDLESAMNSSPGVRRVGLVALERASSVRAAPSLSKPRDSVLVSIADDDPASYRAAAATANDLCDVVVVEHEFGIFGGIDGEMVLDFLDALDVPIVLTLHTVLPEFSPGQRRVLRQACAHAAVVTVFTPTARDLLVAQQIVTAERVEVLLHGAPDRLYEADRYAARQSLKVAGAFVLSTFGLVSEGKGLELAIDAMPAIRAVRSDAVLIIAGQTHPDVLARDGESYRRRLVDRVEALGLGSCVCFVDEFLSIARIAELLAATDIFVTPYVNRDQIVSGALTFALAAGCPTVSTPYQYAIDCLADGAGIIVATRDPSDFAGAVLQLALDPAKLAAARNAARHHGDSMRWSAVGRATVDSCRRAVGVAARARRLPSRRGSAQRVARSSLISVPSTRHLARLVDDTAIVQHARGPVPLLATGYCVDDVARLVPVACWLTKHDTCWDTTVAKSLSFLLDALDDEPSSRMRNLMTWNRTWLDEPHFGDHVGRTLWGVGALTEHDQYGDVAREIVSHLVHDWPHPGQLHPDAYAILGLVGSSGGHEDFVCRLVEELDRSYRRAATADWPWWEPKLRYDHARLPHALIAGGAYTGNASAIDTGMEALHWYDALCDRGSHLRFPGVHGLAAGESLDDSGDEQPLEAFALVQAHLCAYKVTGDPCYLDRARQAHRWFLGANRLGTPVADETEGACHDGLQPDGVNRNEGAESTLAYLASHVSLADAEGRSSLRRLVAIASGPLNIGSGPVRPARDR